MRNAICILFIIVLSYPVDAQTSYKQANTIYYYDTDKEPADSYKQKMCVLDIYYPESQEQVPVIIWFHGGGLTGGSKEIPQALKNKGCIVVGVGYRLSPHVKAKECISDAVAAVAWVFKNISGYHGNTQSIFISGHSAGGYLALMTVMDKKLLNKYSIDAYSVAGLVPFSGHTITHFTIRAENGIEGHRPVIDEFAPLYYVREKAPPILLITGDRELEMLGRYEENAYFYRMMKVAGHDNIKIHELNGYGHDMADPAFPLLLKFIDDHKN